MITIRPFIPGDIGAVGGRQYELEMLRLAGNNGDEFAARGPAFTMLDKDQPVMSAGVVIHWPGVGEAWMHLSPWIYKHPKAAFESTKCILRNIVRAKQLRRVQCPICVDMPANIRWVEHLGFQVEGYLHKWGPEGKDYLMYALISEEWDSCPPQP